MTEYVQTMTERQFEDFLAEAAVRADIVLNQSVSATLADLFYRNTDVADYAALFSQTAYQPLMRKSPWFFSMPPFCAFWLELQSSALPWGFMALGACEPELGLAHWKSLLNALLPDNSLTHFRFYSSAVLTKTAGACDDKELAWLVGPYAWLAAPVPGNEEAPWLRITNPALAEAGPEKIAAAQESRKEAWWQISDRHLEAFSDELETVFRKNLVLWLWENRAEQAMIFHEECGGLDNFVDETLANLQGWGFADHDRQSRALVALLPHFSIGESSREVQAALATAGKDPDAALLRLEALAERREA